MEPKDKSEQKKRKACLSESQSEETETATASNILIEKIKKENISPTLKKRKSVDISNVEEDGEVASASGVLLRKLLSNGASKEAESLVDLNELLYRMAKMTLKFDKLRFEIDILACNMEWEPEVHECLIHYLNESLKRWRSCPITWKMFTSVLKYFAFMKRALKCMICKESNCYAWSCSLTDHKKRVVCNECVNNDKSHKYTVNLQSQQLNLVLAKMVNDYKSGSCAFQHKKCEYKYGVFWPQHEIFCKYQMTKCPMPNCSEETNYYDLPEHIELSHKSAIIIELEPSKLNDDVFACIKFNYVFIFMSRIIKENVYGYALFAIIPHVQTTDLRFKLEIFKADREVIEKVEGACTGIAAQYLCYEKKIYYECFKNQIHFEDYPDDEMSFTLSIHQVPRNVELNKVQYNFDHL